MTEDATLDAFDARDASDGDPESDSGDDSDASGGDPEASEADDSGVDTVSTGDSADAAESPAVDRARSTFEWTPAGEECADCDGSAERRWRRDGQREGGLVCPDCKEW